MRGKSCSKARLRGETLVGAIMSSPVHAVRPDQSVEECMALMTEKRVRHLPVLEHGKLIGMISQGDLVKFIIEDQRLHHWGNWRNDIAR